MVRYHLGWEDAEGRPAEASGKCLRPALCLLACEAVGGEARRALPAAAAVELTHNFSLVHDDIQDRDRERRHRPTIWSIWGDAQAINAGDALLALAHRVLLDLAEEGPPADTVMEAARLLDERTLEMVEGQVMDLEFETRSEVDMASYLDMVDRKTASLFDCSLRLGALAASAEPALVEGLGRFGRALGVAFQLRDDVLGVWGSEEQTGKPPAADIRRRKKSLPIVHALAAGQGETGERLRRVYAESELRDEQVSTVLTTLDELGSREYCERLVEERAGQALAHLDGLALRAPAAGELREVAVYLLSPEP